MSTRAYAFCTAAGLAVMAMYSAETEPTVATFVPGWRSYDWPSPDGFGGTHHSPLSDITAETVEFLEVAWTYWTGDVHSRSQGMAGTAFEATPSMVDGVVYFATPYSRAIALDAETGQELWAFDPALDRTDRFQTGGRQ
jgi:glucose dehydrogenase